MPENGDKQRPNGAAIVRFPWSRGWWQVLFARRDEVTKFRLSIVAGSKSPVVPDTHSPCNDDMPSEVLLLQALLTGGPIPNEGIAI